MVNTNEIITCKMFENPSDPSDDEKEEKSNEARILQHMNTGNPYDDYMSYEHPWERLYQKHLYRAHNDGDTGVLLEFTDHPNRLQSDFQPGFRTIEEMVQDFFSMPQSHSRGGKPDLFLLGQHADLNIIWAVTQGMVRMDVNKRLWVFAGMRPQTIGKVAWVTSLKHSSDGFWESVLALDEWVGGSPPLLAEITRLCNTLYNELLAKLRRFRRRKSNGDYFHNTLKNFENLPRFVRLQRDREHEHKKCLWYHTGITQGGNKGRKRATTAEANRKHSVHYTLQRYHCFLSSIRKRT